METHKVTALGLAKVQQHYYKSDNERVPRRSVNVSWVDLKINGKVYTSASAYQEEYEVLQWPENGEGKPEKAMSWGNINMHATPYGSMTDKARQKVRDAAVAVIAEIDPVSWIRAYVEYREACAAKAQETLAESQKALTEALQELSFAKAALKGAEASLRDREKVS